jgi:hypothetical protein
MVGSGFKLLILTSGVPRGDAQDTGSGSATLLKSVVDPYTFHTDPDPIFDLNKDRNTLKTSINLFDNKNVSENTNMFSSLKRFSGIVLSKIKLLLFS